MADSERKIDVGEPIIWLLVLFFLFQFLAGLPIFIEEKLGGDSSYISSFLNINPSLSVNSPVGTRTVNKKETILFNEPGNFEIGRQPRNARGTAIGGPILYNDTLWWQVKYFDGTTGWVSNKDIEIDLERDRKAIKENTPHGSRILNSDEVLVYSEPGGSVTIANKSKGEKGVIYGGPLYINGERWWQVKYFDGTAGWVPERNIEIDTKNNIRAVKDDTTINTEIKNNSHVDVWSAPISGFVMGNQLENAVGILADGAVLISTTRWWFVDYEKGVDGWVEERFLDKKFAFIESIIFIKDFLLKVSYFISFVAFVAIVYIVSRFRKENIKERKLFGPLATTFEESQTKNPRWEKILEQLDSDNPNDWKQAIINADVLLDEAVTSMAYHGDTLGEKLKMIEKSDFLTIDKAWEAHKMRNMIAHEGTDYILTQREAKRVIGLYEEVFKEFFFV